jgi:hypothetical protein
LWFAFVEDAVKICTATWVHHYVFWRFAKATRAARHFNQSVSALRRSSAVAGAGGARSALGFVRGGAVAPVNELAGFTAVPHLGAVLNIYVGNIHANNEGIAFFTKCIF